MEVRYQNRKSKNHLWDNMMVEGSIGSGPGLSRKGSCIRQRTGSDAIEVELDMSRSEKVNKQRKTLSGSPIDYPIPHFYDNANCLSHSDIMQRIKQAIPPLDSNFNSLGRQRLDTEPEQSTVSHQIIANDHELRTNFA